MSSEPRTTAAWKIDATNWEDADFKNLKAFGDRSIHDFCGEADRTSRDWLSRGAHCILVGRRGLGKSFLLAYRSFHHRSGGKKETFFHPEGGHQSSLVERLTSLSGGIDRYHFLRSVDATDHWSKIWQISIIGLLAWRLCNLSTGLNKFREIFRDLEQLDKIYAKGVQLDTKEDSGAEHGLRAPPLQWFLHNVMDVLPSERIKCQDKLDEFLYAASTNWAANVIAALKDKNLKRIAVYLDNPDELFDPSEGDLWVNVQQGLAHAIWKMQKGGALKDELNIYASVRSEAISYERVHPDLQHVSDLMLRLRYDKVMLEELFKGQIELTDKSNLTQPEMPTNTGAMKAFVGFDEYAHTDKQSQNGVVIEKLFDAIVRHTRYVPRDLIVIGKEINDMRPANDRKVLDVRGKVNDSAKEIVQYARENSFPRWPSLLDKLLENIDIQILSRQELYQLITKSMGAEENSKHIHYLIATGLLGFAEPHPRRYKHYYIQRFIFDEPHLKPDINYDYFFVHPALKEWIRGMPNYSKRWRSSPETIIGNGLPYTSKPPQFKLNICNNQPKITLEGIYPLQASEQSTDPIRFLFLALWAKKSRPGMMAPTINDLKKIKSELGRKYENLYFPNLDGDHSHSGSPIRNWARKIHQIPEIIKFANSNKTEANGKSKKSLFMSINAPVGVDARVDCKVDPQEIYIDESIFFDIALN